MSTVDKTRFFPNKLEDQSNSLMHNGSIRTQFRDRLQDSFKNLLAKMESSIDQDNDDDLTVFTGKGGHAFLYLHLAVNNDSEEREKWLERCSRHLRPCLRGLRGRRISFLCGDPGPLAMGLVVDHLRGRGVDRELHSKLLQICEKAKEGDFPDELLYGRAGLLYSLLFVRRHCHPDIVIGHEHVREVVQSILRRGEEFSKRVGSELPLMYEWHEKQYIGAAHGVAGILFMLLQAKEFLTEEELNRLVKPSVDALARWRFPSGNFHSSVGSTSDRLVQWCHGSPGVVHLFLKASEVFPKDADKYLSVTRSSSEVIWTRGLLRKGYGLCHGAAGNAYAFLALHEITGDDEDLRRGLEFANWCCDYGRHGASIPDEPYSLLNGLAGTVLFLNDVLRGRNKFPAFEI